MSDKAGAIIQSNEREGWGELPEKLAMMEPEIKLRN
jgi:hypothetical protein